MKWAESVGGLSGLVERAEGNLAAISAWVDRTPWVDFLVADPAVRSSTSVCLKISDPWFAALDAETRATAAKRIPALLDGEGVAYDLGAYRDAPPGLRIWAGATVEQGDLEALFPWLDWAFETLKAEMA